jgi:hypothetical protein
MKPHAIRHLSRLLPAAFMLLLAACGGSADSDSNQAQIRLLNLSSGYESLDLYSRSQDDSADQKQFSDIAQGSVSAYASLENDSYTLKARKAGASGDLFSWSATLAADTHLTIVAYGGTNQFAVLGINEDIDAPGSGQTKVQVLNTTTAEGFDVYLTGANDSLNDVSATVGGVAAGSQSSAISIASGTYRLRVTATGSKTDLRLNVPEISLSTAGVLSIILTETTGGILVNAVLLPQQGSPTVYDNTASARIRLLNVSGGYDTVDLYTTSGGSDIETRQFTAVTRGTATGYAALKADTYTLKFRKTGAAGNLLSLSTTLIEDRHLTYVAYGAASGFGVQALDDDVEAPGSGFTKLRILNGTTADKLDVYLTGAGDSLMDVAPAGGEVAAGTLSDVSTVSSGSYRLRIAGSGSKTDVRLDVPTVTLPSAGVVTLVLTESGGGVLVNALLLPQQGEPTVYNNSRVRIRGALGLSTGAVATLNVAGTDIVNRRSARSYLGDTYATLASGNAAVSVTVDGVVVASGTVALEAGRDYTLMVWDGGTTLKTTLITDDNRASTSHRARLRMINGLSGAVVPVTLAIDYSPVIEYVEVGTASESIEVNPGTDYRFDLINAQTLGSMLGREDVPLDGDGVYTLLVAGGGASAVTATLRKDR